MRLATSDFSDVVNQNRGTRQHPSSGCLARTEPNPPLAKKSPTARTRMFPSSSLKLAKSETSNFAAILSEAGEMEFRGGWVRGDRLGVGGLGDMQRKGTQRSGTTSRIAAIETGPQYLGERIKRLR